MLRIKKLEKIILRLSIVESMLAKLKVKTDEELESNKEELDMHLETINQNTNDIVINYENLLALEGKVDKLTEKIDEIQAQLNPGFYNQDFSSINLSKREQELFIGLYTIEDRITIPELSKKTGFPPDTCEFLVKRLSSKGIPIIRQALEQKTYLSLDYRFKDLQARKNILGIDISILRST